MSKLERKYTWKHIVIILLLFVLAGGVNVIPRHSVVSSPCTTNSKAQQAVKITSRGWPLTYGKKYEATKICLTFKNGKYVNSADAQPKQQLNAGALVINELIILAVVGSLLWLIGLRKAKK